MDDYKYIPFENIDRLLLVELRERNMPVGVIPKLYTIARGDVPISYLSAEMFIKNPGAKVGIVTGVEELQYMPHGEIDGLPGSVILARALGKLGHEVKIITENGCVPVINSLIREMGAANTSAVNASELSDDDIAKLVQEMGIGVAIEKIGVNKKGFTHTIEGKSFDSKPGPFYADKFINGMNAKNKPTLGYGDGGNEIGFGKIYDKACEIAPFGAKCQCPCGGGMVTSTATSILWPVNVSNFGAYGTVASLAMLSNKPELALTSDELLKALDVSVAAGAVDGGTGQLIPGEDGIPAPAAAAFVQIMHGIVEKSFSLFERPF